MDALRENQNRNKKKQSCFGNGAYIALSHRLFIEDRRTPTMLSNIRLLAAVLDPRSIVAIVFFFFCEGKVENQLMIPMNSKLS